MQKRSIFILLFLIVSLLSFGQDEDGIIRFNNVYADTIPAYRNIVEVDSGYICVGGAYNSINENQILVSFIDSLGNLIWSKKYGFSGYDTYHGRENSLVKTIDGGYALAGSLEKNNQTDCINVLVKFNKFLDTLWTKQYLPDTMFTATYQCRQTLDSGFVLVGTKKFIGDNYSDILLIRTDSQGDMLWYKRYGDNVLSAKGNCITLTKDEGFVIGGWKGDLTYFYSGDNYIIRTDSAGNIIWTETFGSNEYNDYGVQNIITTKDSGYVMTGFKVYFADAGTNSCRARILKMDDTGEIVWDKEYEDQGEGVGFFALLELEDGSIVVTGTYNESYHSNTLYKLSSEGEEIWNRHYDTPNADEIFCYIKAIVQTRDRGFAMAGYGGYWDLDPMQQMRVIKVDSCGCDTMGCVCDDTGIPNVKSECDIILYPNPADKFVNVITDQYGNEKINIEIFNIQGRKIMDLTNQIQDNRISINISELPRGLYLIKLFNNKYIITNKFIKI